MSYTLKDESSISSFAPSGFDVNLLRKYNVPGPRYTSYPTALAFSEDVDRQQLLHDLKQSGEANTPLSLYFHLPFCQSACWFCGCTRIITRNPRAADRYLDSLEKEIELTRPHLGEERRVVQMHFGGGTPTFFTPDQVERLGELIHNAFAFAPGAETSVEVDPRRIEREHVRAWSALGCGRASLGVQDNTPRVQQAINRIQPKEVTAQVVQWLREEGFRSINIDLIYGLPFQTVATFEKTLDEILELEPDRLAVFSYAHVPWSKPAQKLLDRQGGLPEASVKLAILERVAERLADAGYVYIGMDHFAKLGDELATAQENGTLQRNFQGYSTKAGTEILGFGMSAISQTPNGYRQNHKEMRPYQDALEKGDLPWNRGYILTEEDHRRRDTIHRLMCDLRLDFTRQSDRLGIDFEKHYAAEIAALAGLEKDGLLTRAQNGIEVTPAGRFLIRNIAMTFDAYLDRSTSRYSKTV